ncbi:hypothetical protein F7725_008603 [Dissostichus mawsoni]|uniref:MOSC domain-containing protein n=1 Tax=Dissostichus mawsoni TaxID=36200 RepID=A0A7J5Y7V9_DISMA|nr:hypothetical protein F7725_008603 [Dissostichus mawsoni]
MELKTLALNAFAQNKRAALLIGGAGVAFLGLGLGYKYLRKPEKVVRVGVVSQLLIHPLKSGRAVSVPLAECLQIGLKFGELQDRHWLVVTEQGHMVTGRQQPRLVLLSLTCEDGHVCLSGPDMEELRFPGRDCGEETSRWLIRFLGKEQTFRLVHFEPQMRGRRTEPLLPPFEVAYSDEAPVMLLSEASVQDLSSRLEEDVTVKRFRPSIVISDCEAFAEDSWVDIQIGSVRLQRVKSCGRCIFTTVDPETGVISRKEPLDTLKSYRLCKPSDQHIYQKAPLFGQLLIVKQEGTLQVGDVVYKISR